MAIKIGNSGNNILNGTNGSDLLIGLGGNDTLNGGAGTDILSGGGGNDTLNGGSGSDLVSGDAGNDILIYKMAENTGSIDLYDGGSGTDTLRLELTGAEWAKAGVKADVAAFLHDPHQAFVWHSTGLVTNNFEQLTLVVDGQVVDPTAPPPVNHAPVATADFQIGAITEEIDNVAAGNVISDAPGVDVDADGDSLIIVGLAAGLHDSQLDGNVGTSIMGTFGSLTMQADGSWNYTFGGGADPSWYYYGPHPNDVFSYTVSDGRGGFDTATLTIDVISTGPGLGLPPNEPL